LAEGPRVFNAGNFFQYNDKVRRTRSNCNLNYLYKYFIFAPRDLELQIYDVEMETNTGLRYFQYLARPSLRMIEFIINAGTLSSGQFDNYLRITFKVISNKVLNIIRLPKVSQGVEI
jgi:hypothetical protein